MLQIIINGIKFNVEVSSKADKENRVVVFYENNEYSIFNVLYFLNEGVLTHEELKNFIKVDLHSNNIKKFESINKIEICVKKIDDILNNLESAEYNIVLEKLDL